MAEKNEVTRSEEGLRERQGRNAPAGAVVRGSLLGAGVLLVAALVVIVNYFGWKYHARLDWTGSDFYTLSEQSENVLASLDRAGRDVDVVVFMEPVGELYEEVRELLSRYEAESSRISVRWLDPQRNPAEVQRLVDQYGVTTRSVVFSTGDQRRAVSADELEEIDYSATQFGGQPEVSAFKGEQLFTNALVDLTQEEVPRVLFTTGHGELRLDRTAPRNLAGLVDVLGKDNFKLEEWSLRGADAVPEDADLVVIAGPTSSFFPSEIEVLDAYLTGGGRLLVMLDPVLAPAGGSSGASSGDSGLLETGLEPWLAGYGVDVGDDLVLEADGSKLVLGYGPETFVVDDYTAHPVVGSLGEREIPLILSVARSVSAGTAPDGARALQLFRTSADAWGETDVTSTEELAPGGDDPRGPLSLAVVVEAEDGADDQAAGEAADADGADGAKSSGLRLAVIGDSDIAAAQLVANPGLGNAAFVGNLFNWMVERRALLGIPPKRPEQVRLSMSSTELRWSVLGVTVVLPALAILAGIWVWSRRRRAS